MIISFPFYPMLLTQLGVSLSFLLHFPFPFCSNTFILQITIGSFFPCPHTSKVLFRPVSRIINTPSSKAERRKCSEGCVCTVTIPSPWGFVAWLKHNCNACTFAVEWNLTPGSSTLTFALHFWSQVPAFQVHVQALPAPQHFPHKNLKTINQKTQTAELWLGQGEAMTLRW